MPAAINITGQRFGRLVALLQHSRRTVSGSAYWLCLCDCDRTVVAVSSDLKKGHTKSCGCIVLKHGQSRKEAWTGAYTTWRRMLDRCRNPKNVSYKYYGARGITVCDRWLEFKNFVADMGGRPPGMTLDRLDPDGNYEPGNCRWATASQQRKNRK